MHVKELRIHKEIIIFIVNLFLTKVPRIFIGEGTVCSTNGAGTTGYPYAKKVNLDLYLTLPTKLTQKWIMDLNEITKMMKLAVENIEENH